MRSISHSRASSRSSASSVSPQGIASGWVVSTRALISCSTDGRSSGDDSDDPELSFSCLSVALPTESSLLSGFLLNTGVLTPKALHNACNRDLTRGFHRQHAQNHLNAPLAPSRAPLGRERRVPGERGNPATRGAPSSASGHGSTLVAERSEAGSERPGGAQEPTGVPRGVPDGRASGGRSGHRARRAEVIEATDTSSVLTVQHRSDFDARTNGIKNQRRVESTLAGIQDIPT